MYRHINIDPLSPPLQLDRNLSSRPYARAVAYHVTGLFLSLIVFDIASYLPLRLAPHTFGSVNYVGGDFDAWCVHLAEHAGVPVLLIRAFFSLCLVTMIHSSLLGLGHYMAAICIGLGIHIPEEWPDIAKSPVSSSSVNEFWGRQYHQLLRVRPTIPAWSPSVTFLLISTGSY